MTFPTALPCSMSSQIKSKTIFQSTKNTSLSQNWCFERAILLYAKKLLKPLKKIAIFMVKMAITLDSFSSLFQRQQSIKCSWSLHQYLFWFLDFFSRICVFLDSFYAWSYCTYIQFWWHQLGCWSVSCKTISWSKTLYNIKTNGP